MSQRRTAVVTGGAGFIGSHMVDLLLEQDLQVRVIDDLSSGRENNLAHVRSNKNLVVEVRDICSLKPDDALFKDADFVFHFAGKGDIVPAIEQPDGYVLTNCQGTVRVLEAARSSRVLKKFVYAASSSCYGLTRELPTTEAAPIDTQHPYALSKYLGERAVLHWGAVYRMPVNSIRIFNAYGTRARTSGAYGAVFGVFLKQKLANKPFTVVGDGTQTRDFVYVTDVAKAFLAAAETEVVNEIFNIGAGKPQPVNLIVKLMGGSPVYLPKRPGEPDCTWADISKIGRMLGWKPVVAFEDGVKKMLDGIDHWKDAPLWDPASIDNATKTWFKYLSKENR